MNIMVDRQQLVDTLNQNSDINYVLHDYVCVEHNHTPEELQYLITRLNQAGMGQWFVQNMLDWYKRKLTICSVQKPNPKYDAQQSTFLNGFLTEPEFITLYYF
jgi:hypothetical protein